MYRRNAFDERFHGDSIRNISFKFLTNKNLFGKYSIFVYHCEYEMIRSNWPNFHPIVIVIGFVPRSDISKSILYLASKNRQVLQIMPSDPVALHNIAWRVNIALVWNIRHIHTFVCTEPDCGFEYLRCFDGFENENWNYPTVFAGRYVVFILNFFNQWSWMRLVILDRFCSIVLIKFLKSCLSQVGKSN